MFTVIKSASTGIGPRLGRLALPGKKVVHTPHYLGITSRGVIPHITQDTFARDASITGVYVGLEDFIERAPYQTPPLYQFKPPKDSSPLRRFIALPEDTLLVLGARRAPPVAAPAANPNTNETVSVCTAVGFRVLRADDYAEAAERLQADIVVGLGDIPYGRKLGNKRIEKATERNIKWTQDHINLRHSAETRAQQAKLFAPLLPVSSAKQRFYIETLIQVSERDVAGLAVYALDSLEDLPEALQPLPRLGFTTPSAPQDVLQHIVLGIDVLTVPFINAATDAGIALSFQFPSTSCDQSHNGSDPLPLGIDMWSPAHAVDLGPLVDGCTCYACANHHRAYIQHLLAAKEMLGWVLLQLHNHHVTDIFFAHIRASIANGTFTDDVEHFQRKYESRLPEKTGQGPRVRGYQFKAEGPGEPKKNKAPFTMLDDGQEKIVESAPPEAGTDASELEAQGFAAKA
ncbi:hypothetical protein BAUCODRAFT_75044 [Baudoinia panamericana UAMH 10762]|uniref:Queuine tRNA-ribosyltransferase accessory subunit 2 n=1 Tax=Baudoinia panamericana (strain UAMH 10762) TaxID=717646 RepID=M2MQK9_BAUPA|nr:uncharacterized protein BAUCODRAFT_75044 [Baudoinia panamericana UAMH 10762]EMC93778.1 hypothetical protein BAUCODRAFT_75044 [Baudoinia panamericana UAMH 10762]